VNYDDELADTYVSTITHSTARFHKRWNNPHVLNDFHKGTLYIYVQYRSILYWEHSYINWSNVHFHIRWH